MSRVGIVSGYSCSLAWWARLQDEGNEVRVWNKNTPTKRVGEGIVPLAGTFDEVYDFVKMGTIKHEPSLLFFDASGMGDLAERARRSGISVVGGGEFCDKLEDNREFGFKIAEEAGCQLPPYESFTSLKESIAKADDGEHFFKTDHYFDANATKMIKSKEHQIEYFKEFSDLHGDRVKHILQEKIEGVALSTARWFNGRDFVGPYEATYEHKAFMDGDLGGSTGCSFNAVFFHDQDPEIAQDLGWDNLTLTFRKNNAPPGLYDMNCIIAEDGQVYFLEWTPRLGYDSEMTSHRLFPSLSEHLFAMAEGRDMPTPKGDIAYSIRLSVGPYPFEHGTLDMKGCCDGQPITNTDGLWDKNFVGYQVRQDPKSGLCVAGPEGIVGLSLATGKSLEAVHDEAFEYAKDLHKEGINGLQFRTDGAKCIKEDAEKVKEAGHEVHPGLLT